MLAELSAALKLSNEACAGSQDNDSGGNADSETTGRSCKGPAEWVMSATLNALSIDAGEVLLSRIGTFRAAALFELALKRPIHRICGWHCSSVEFSRKCNGHF
jgi:hypothetical protein